MTAPGAAALVKETGSKRGPAEVRVLPVPDPPESHGGYRLQPEFYEPKRVPQEVLQFSSRPGTLAVGSPGKVGVLQLDFELHDGTTQLMRHYQKSPLQIMRPLYFNLERPDMPYVYLTSTGGGILQGDRLRTDLRFGPDTSAHVTTQAASKIYKMDSDYATSLMNLTVERGAHVEYLPDPVIPFERSRMYQQTSVVLDETATLLVGETIYAGRLAREERHAYDVYASDLEVRRPSGALVALDRVRLSPSAGGIDGLGVLADHDVLAMLYVFVPDAATVPALADALLGALEPFGEASLIYGVSALPSDAGVWMRLVGNDTVAVARASTAVAAAAHTFVLGTPAPNIRKS
ncbi:urease accessory protein UreD [Salinibacterium hongtaonis]|uniref:Urease accessory protein UreD n=1 Tax=Homoserinimonas hongtaonis TaxID=2079791 RepID=A0A2U1SXW1_9MICO|nr:urease accessory protein UreD [Salinibacterium hongtaonis]PWB96428.1 urease accessory protein [Salinibacterium hongtaonis]